MLKYFYLLIIILLMLLNACSERFGIPAKVENNSVIFLPKDNNGIIPSIIFGSKVSSKTGKVLNTDTVFTIKEDAKLYAVIDLKNRELNFDKALQFHINWLEPDGSLLYRKEIILERKDSSSYITSSITITPDKRVAGSFMLQLYYFRELIAEKKFILQPKKKDVANEIRIERLNRINVNITLCRKIGGKTGKLIGTGTSFTIKKKNKVYAIIDLKNLNPETDRNLKISLEWTGPDSSSFYNKHFKLSPKDSTVRLESSITIYPNKRQPGNYSIKVYLLKDLIAEKIFALNKETKKRVSKKSLRN